MIVSFILLNLLHLVFDSSITEESSLDLGRKRNYATVNFLKIYFVLSYRGRKRFVSEGDGGRLKLESY